MSGFLTSPLWFATRATGIVAFLTLTLVLALGVVSTQRRLAGPRWPRFVTQGLHRNAALLAVGLLVVHVATTIIDGYVDMGWTSAVIPFASNYERFGVALGTTAADLGLVIVGTSLLRTRLSLAAWRRVHLSAYLLWPLTLAHFLLTGTDAKHGRWGLWLGLKLCCGRTRRRGAPPASSRQRAGRARPIRRGSDPMTVLDLPVRRDTASRLLAGTAAVSARGDHLATYGPLPDIAPEQLLSALDTSGLRGRGGAGFPTARKVRTVAAARRPILVANAMEGEPASRKDGVLATHRPHLILDGVLATARTIGARRAYVAVHRGSAAARSLRAALAERSDVGRLTVSIDEPPARYVAGEESALVAWLNGRPAKPTFPHRPFERGVDGRPTLVDNAETLAQIALLARFGPDWFRSVGVPAEPGTLLVTVGVGRNATVVEIPVGLTLGTLLEGLGWQRDAVAAVLVGGYFGRWLPAEVAWRTPLSHGGLRAAGGLLGAGIVIPIRASACGLAETAHVLRYLANESAGQCGPCMFGLPAVAEAFHALSAGRIDERQLAGLGRWLDVVPGRGACRNPDGALQLAGSALTTFAEDLDGHLHGQPCAAATLSRRLLPVPAVDPSSTDWR